MSTLIVLLPPRDPAVPSQEWQLPEMPFMLVDKSGRKERAGRAALAFLPRATMTMLVVAARDVLMLTAVIPPLKGLRLKQALPNVVEDQLIQDAQTCHIALDPQPLPDGARVLAVIDRSWFHFMIEAFAAVGHRNLRAVPLMRCLPTPSQPCVETPDQNTDEIVIDVSADVAAASRASPLVVLALGRTVKNAPAIFVDAAQTSPPLAMSEAHVELALARGALGEGVAVPASELDSTLTALAGDARLELYTLTDLPVSNEPQLTGDDQSIVDVAHDLLSDAPAFSFDTFTRRALECRFDLCQFEFEARPWQLDRATLRRLRLPSALVAATLAVAVIGINVQWWMLSREREALATQMTELLLNAFPKTTVILDPPGQMTQQLDHLRVVAGELSPHDFLSIAARLSHSLGTVPVNGIAALDYHDHRLEVTFKPEVKVDAGLTQRLTRNGLTGEIDSSSGKWVIKNGSAPS